MEAWEEETSKTRRGKSDPLVQTKQAVGFGDKGNAIHHVTVNATHASPVWLHSAFRSFNFKCHDEQLDQPEICPL